MLKIVKENPSEFTIVIAVPLYSAGTLWATIVENWGESAVTKNPQIPRNGIQIKVETSKKPIIGTKMQQIDEPAKANNATKRLPFLAAIKPPNPQETDPIAMIPNDKSELRFSVN